MRGTYWHLDARREELAAIDAKWKAAAEDITPLDIALERADVTVTELVLGWLPVG